MTPIPTLDDRLLGLTLSDQHRLGRRLPRARGPADLAALEEAISLAEALVDRRRAAVPQLSYPDSLPVSARRDEIIAAIRDHQVVVVAGETGSGKTTQIPKMCLELGRGVKGTIGHTQPRRIAARTVAERLADELGVALGGPVGFAVRFDDRVAETTLVKVMTDGILLAEIQRDPDLRRYDTIIVDEAHERSLNIDFLLGYLTQLLPRRPDLKVVITSATIDTARFASHFDAPVVEVSGRTYPVELRYRPVADDADDRDRDQGQAICDAVSELAAEGPGDILVFLSGERDIRDAADALRASGIEGIDILPLYARLSSAEQHKVFRPHKGRRVVLATNVAETSLTVPGVRYVVDTGTARVSRYSARTKVQRLPIEPVSQASANQRSGRCGRVAPGICIRLYSEEDFDGRRAFTDPEILRTNLASVILQMAAIGLGDIESFPFIEAPDRRSIADGMTLLSELGAWTEDNEEARRPRLSRIGKRMAQLPLDPRLGRMILEAEARECLREVSIIAAALSIQDPRERPADKQQAAAEMHRRFVVGDSDFLSYLKLWEYLADKQGELSGNQFRKLCRSEFLNVLRVREWQDLVGQLRQVYRSHGMHQNKEPASPDQIHQALLAGLLSNIGMRDKARGDYQGTRQTRWQVGRGSALGRRSPAWAMAASLVETEGVWARTVAGIDPAWVEKIGAHLVKRSFGDPWWDSDRGEAVAEERISLYGLPVVPARRISFSRVDPSAARELFIQAALVDGDWNRAKALTARTQDRIDQIRRLEDRVRRRDLLADDDARYCYYDQVIPERVVNAKSFERWWRDAKGDDPEVLDVPLRVLVDPDAGPISFRDWPDEWRQGELRLPLQYRFTPGEANDGVSVIISLAALNRVAEVGFDWNVPGLRAELLTSLIRTLPKAYRRELGPAAEVATDILKSSGPSAGALRETVARELSRRCGASIGADLLNIDHIPEHLRMSFEVVDADGKVCGRSRDLLELKRVLRDRAAQAVAAAVPGISHPGATSWQFGDIPARVESQGVVGYPSLIDQGDSVGVRVLDTAGAQADQMWRGTRRLLLLAAPLPVAHVQRRLSSETRSALARWAEPVADVLADCAATAADDIITAGGGPAHDALRFAHLAEMASKSMAERVITLATIAGGVIAAAERVEERTAQLTERDRGMAFVDALNDVRSQLDSLVHPGFVASAQSRHLGGLLRYLAALTKRLDDLPSSPARDATRMEAVSRVKRRYDLMVDQILDGTATPAVMGSASRLRWMIEELRVSLFAQTLGTAAPVSVERISRAMDAVEAGSLLPE